MPFAKALKSFRGRYGLIRAGTSFNCEPGYYAQLAKKGWVEAATDPAPASKDKPAPGPADNRDKGGAPGRAGKESAGQKPASSKGQSSSRGTVRPPAAGKATTSRSLRADLRSQSKTPPSSEGGEKNPDPPKDPDAALP